MAKTKPHTVRFEEEDFNFICKKENLKTAQGIVSFLMSNYIKLYRVEKKSIFEVYDKEDGVALDIKTPIQKDSRNNNFKIKRSFEYFMQARRSCQDEDDWMELKEEILNSDLSEKQKILLTT